MSIKELETSHYNEVIDSLYNFLVNCGDWPEVDYHKSIDMIDIRLSTIRDLQYESKSIGFSSIHTFQDMLMEKLLSVPDLSHRRILTNCHYFNAVMSVCHRTLYLNRAYIKNKVLTLVDINGQIKVEVSLRK